MFRKLVVLLFVLSGPVLRSQEMIKPTDVIQGRAIIVMQGITSVQLDAIKAEFEKYNEITSATYVYRDHNCLLVEVAATGNLKHYTDLLKIIQIATAITAEQLPIKTPLAFNEILGKEDDNTNVVLK